MLREIRRILLFKDDGTTSKLFEEECTEAFFHLVWREIKNLRPSWKLGGGPLDARN